MNYHNITTCDMSNFEGLRVVLWLSHCEHKCKGCHNPQAWSKNSGISFDEDVFEELCNELSKPYHRGLTLSGGDPLSSLNRNNVSVLMEVIKTKFPDKDICVYTGYTLEQLQNANYKGLEYIDYLIDGRFEIDKLSPDKKWVGSSNQRLFKKVNGKFERLD